MDENTNTNNNSAEPENAVSAPMPVPASASSDPVCPSGGVTGENLVKIIMPSVGDMQLVAQDGGVLLFRPVYFGGECAGPIVQRVESRSDGTERVMASYRIKIRSNGELKLAKAD